MSLVFPNFQSQTGWQRRRYNEQNRPYLHMYVELERDALLNNAMSATILKDLLSTYFKYIDQDYRDLKKILGMDPLQVTTLLAEHLKLMRNGQEKNCTI